ncbi:MAG: type II toxin-antitoxin system PemK/MazF family toxin [Rickettsia endosymbiont of Pentastiridius leporinus]
MEVVNINRFDILLISLDPSKGAEIQKTRPCLVISPNEMNKYINTLIIAPMTSTIKNYPTRVAVTFDGKKGSIVLDQIRTIDKSRIVKRLGVLDNETINLVFKTLEKIFT